MKSKLLPTTLLVLILLNVVLVFLLIKKPHLNAKPGPQKNYLTEELQFSKDQKDSFKMLDKEHKEKMMHLEHQIMRQKDILFNAFGNTSINIDSIAIIAGSLEAKKDLEIFQFFSKVRNICNKEQQAKFDVIINKAIRLGKPGPPNKGNHPPRNGEMPPPPKMK